MSVVISKSQLPTNALLLIRDVDALALGPYPGAAVTCVLTNQVKYSNLGLKPPVLNAIHDLARKHKVELENH